MPPFAAVCPFLPISADPFGPRSCLHSTAGDVCDASTTECSLTVSSWYTLDSAGISSVYAFTPGGGYTYDSKKNCSAACLLGGHIQYRGDSWRLDRAANTLTFVNEACTDFLVGVPGGDPSQTVCFSCASPVANRTYPARFSDNCLVFFVTEGPQTIAYYQVPARAADSDTAAGLSAGAAAGIAIAAVVVALVGVAVVLRLRARDGSSDAASYKTIPANESEASGGEEDEDEEQQAADAETGNAGRVTRAQFAGLSN